MNRMLSPIRRFAGFAPALVFSIVALLPVCAGDATRTRPSGSSGGGQTSGSSQSGRAGQIGSSGPVSVSGKSTWGRYGHHTGYHGYPYYINPWYGAYGGYGWYGGLYWHAGYPFFGAMAPWYGGAASYPVVQIRGGSQQQKAPALLELDLNPRKTVLTLDGEDLGKTRAFNGNLDLLPVAPGRRTFVFHAKGYRTFTMEFDVRAGTMYRLEHYLEKGEGEDPSSVHLEPDVETVETVATLPERSIHKAGIQKGLLNIVVLPSDAAVYLDEEFIGSGSELSALHGALSVAAGTHTLQVVRPGYRPFNIQVEVKPGKRASVETTLEPQD
jgi:hypothetical protein